jgi:hypothetical protein
MGSPERFPQAHDRFRSVTPGIIDTKGLSAS